MIWGLSLHGWEDVMRASLAIAGLFGLIVGLATWFVVKLQREELAASKQELDLYKIDAGERIAAANAAGEAAKADAAAANARALEAQAELAKLKSPRSLSPEQQRRLVVALSPFAGQKYSFNVFADPEPINLMRLIDTVLKSAGWIRIGSQVGDIEIEGAGTANNSGLQIGVKRESTQLLQFVAIELARTLTSEELPAALAFIAELKFADAININVGKKP